jgi:hypothetical protein
MASFRDRLQAVAGRNIIPILAVLDIKPACERCWYFNPNAGVNQAYKCCVAGSCVAATLHPDAQANLWKDLGWITEAEQLQLGRARAKYTIESRDKMLERRNTK